MTQDSKNYLAKKQFFNKLLTVYGRNPVKEALMASGIKVHRLHLADSNKKAAIMDEIISLAKQHSAEIVYHSREQLSRISKNKKQDQGVAVDLMLEGFQDAHSFIENAPKNFQIIALDKITNPQNLGMIIRSVCASPMTALLLPTKGSAKLDSLVIKASAGTLFKAAILRCDQLGPCLREFKEHHTTLVGLDSNADSPFQALDKHKRIVYVMGNETEGISDEVKALCDHSVSIPMQNKVESLNVAVTASLIAFRSVL